MRTHSNFYQTTAQSSVHLSMTINESLSTSALSAGVITDVSFIADTTFTILDASTSTTNNSVIRSLLSESVLDADLTLTNDVTVIDNDVILELSHENNKEEYSAPETRRASRSTRRRSAIPVPMSQTAGPSSAMNERQMSDQQSCRKIDRLPTSSAINIQRQKQVATPTRITNIKTRTPVKARALKSTQDKIGTPKSKMASALRSRTPSTPNRTGSRSNTPRGRAKTPKTPQTPKTPKSNRKVACTKKDVLLNAMNSGKKCPKTPGSGAGFVCVKCGKSFASEAKLDVHFALHVRETPEKCGIPRRTLKRTLIKHEVRTV